MTADRMEHALDTPSRLPSAGERIPTGLYIHVPFCETKCGYCDFYSVPLKDRDTASLTGALIRELEHRVRADDENVCTIFCGGGTPTVLPVEHLAALLGAVRRRVDMRRIVEFTVEANPATVDAARASLLVRSGVTRVSMGAQSFYPQELATLERLHSPDDIAPSVRVLREHGVGQINIDLIFGIPGQTLDTWAVSLRRAMDLEPDHIACYGLTYEPGTRLTAMRTAGRLRPCDESLEIEMYHHAIDVLERAGFEQYETSNFARPRRRCLHNLIYWRNLPYIGVGPSAAGCVGGRRYKNIADVHGYIRSVESGRFAEVESERVEGVTLMLEMLLMQLRLIEGLSIEDFRRRCGVDPRELLADPLVRFERQGLLTVTDAHIALTRAGRLVADWITNELACALGPMDTALPVIA